MTPQHPLSDMAAAAVIGDQGGTPADPPMTPPVTPPETPPVIPPVTPPQPDPVVPPDNPDPNDGYDPMDPNPDEMDEGHDITPILPGEDEGLPGGGNDLHTPGPEPRSTPM